MDVINGLAGLDDVTDHYLIAMDIEQLYNNFPHQEGLEALTYFLANRVDAVPPSEFLIQLTDFIIHNNVFLFMDRVYKQIIGVPMGCCFSPNFSNLFLGLWEELHVLNPVNPFFHCITWYGRYIDDLLFVFKGSEAQVIQFHEYLNSINDNIKSFSSEFE